jgi:hypothetical protein
MAKNLTIEELLAQAEAKSKPKRRCENNVNVQKYIERMGFKPGTLAVPTCVIFHHYRAIYDQTHDKAKATKPVFFRTFSKHIPSCRKNHQRYYLLNEDSFELTEELINTARAYDKQHWNRKKKVRLPRQEGNNES